MANKPNNDFLFIVVCVLIVVSFLIATLSEVNL